MENEKEHKLKKVQITPLFQAFYSFNAFCALSEAMHILDFFSFLFIHFNQEYQ